MFLTRNKPSQGMMSGNDGTNIGVDRTGLQALYLGSGYDTTGNGNTGTASGAVTYSADTYGKYVDFNGNKDFTAGTGTLANITIPNVASLNFTQANNHSWCCTFSMVSLPPNNNTGVFGSAFDSGMQVFSTGAFTAGLRGSSDTAIGVGTLYWAGRLGETHTLGLSYDSAATKYYLYLDGVLQNVGGTTGPATFLTNTWGIGDSYIMGGNPSSGRKKVYRAGVWNRVLSQAEQFAFHNAATNLSIPSRSLDFQLAGNANDSSGNGFNGTLVNSPTLTVDQKGNSNAYTFNGTTQYINTSSITLLNNVSGYTFSFWFKPVSKLTRSRPIATGASSILSIYYGDVGGSGTNLQWFVGNGTGFSAGKATASAITFGAWQMITIVYDGANGYLYKNGLLLDSQAYVGGSATMTGLLQYGSNGANYCEGDFGRLQVFSSALTASQVYKLYYQSV